MDRVPFLTLKLTQTLRGMFLFQPVGESEHVSRERSVALPRHTSLLNYIGFFFAGFLDLKTWDRKPRVGGRTCTPFPSFPVTSLSAPEITATPTGKPTRSELTKSKASLVELGKLTLVPAHILPLTYLISPRFCLLAPIEDFYFFKSK